MPKFRKKALLIEAEQFHPTRTPWPDGVFQSQASYTYYVNTVHGVMKVHPDDWIVTDEEGGIRRPRDPVAFTKLYEAEPQLKSLDEIEDGELWSGFSSRQVEKLKSFLAGRKLAMAQRDEEVKHHGMCECMLRLAEWYCETVSTTPTQRALQDDAENISSEELEAAAEFHDNLKKEQSNNDP